MLQHKFLIEHQDGRGETRTSTLCENGDPKKYFAMACLVGTSCAIGKFTVPMNDSIGNANTIVNSC